MNFFGVEVVFGSQTGTAEDVAKWLAWKLRGDAVDASVSSGNIFKEQSTPHTHRLHVFIISTAGNGDPPLNFRKLWDSLFSEDSISWSSIPFAVFGLGDSKYTQFNYAARMLFGRLRSLGASPVIPLGCGDDQHKLGYSQEFVPWVHLLWRSALGREFVNSVTLPELCTRIFPVTQADPTTLCDSALVLSNSRMTSPDHFQDVRKLVFRLPAYWKFSPGDVLSVTPRVPTEIAQKFIQETLNENESRIIQIDSKNSSYSCSLLHLFTGVLDITATPNHVFYEVLYDSFCEQIRAAPNATLTDEQETIRDKLKLLASFSPEGVEERLHYSGRERMSIYEVLFDFKNANVRMPCLERLVECIPKISPRYYSVCNRMVSRRQNFLRPTNHYIPFVDVEICVGLVEYTTLYGRHREGLTSRFFKTLCPGDVVSGTVRLERGFSPELPHRIENVSNLILVGPGTGIAPCRAIIQEYGNSGKKFLLLTGFRNPKTDFLFGTDIQDGWGSESVSTIVAWSRPDTMDRGLNYSWNEWVGTNCEVGPGAKEGRKTWVQDLIPLFKDKLQGMMMKGEGLIIICGRSHPMPQQVTDELVGINKNLDIVYDTWG